MFVFVCFGSEFEGMVHYVGEVMTEECDVGDPLYPRQEAGRDECEYSACFFSLVVILGPHPSM